MSSAKASRTDGFHRGLPGCGYHFGRGSCKALVRVQSHAPILGCCKQCIGKIFLLVLFEQRGGNPSRLVAMQHLSRLRQIARPEHIGFGGAWAVVSEHESGDSLEKIRVPKVSSRYGQDSRL